MEIKWQYLFKFQWFKNYYLLFIYGFLLNFSLALPYRYEYYLQFKNISENELIERYYPVQTYAATGAFVFVLLFTDISGYYLFNILTVVCSITSLGLVIWGTTDIELILAQVFLGCQLASQLSYYVSIYAHCQVEHFQIFTAITRGAALIATMLACFFAQIFATTNALDFSQTIYFDFAALILSGILAILLPKVPQNEKSDKFETKPRKLLLNLKSAFPNKFAVKWSLWIGFSICGFNQTAQFVHPLWKSLGADVDLYGAKEGLNAFVALFATIFAAFAHFDWKFKGDLILSLTSLVQSFMLLFMSQFQGVTLNFVFYLGFNFIYYFTLTLAIAETAKLLKKECFGIVFGCAALFGMILNSIFVFCLNQKTSDTFKTSEYFFTFGSYHLIVAVIYIVVGLIYWFAKNTFE